MPPTLALGYDDFLLETAYELDFGRDTSRLDSKQRELLHSVIQTGVRNVLSPLIPGTTEVYEWSWARPVRTLVVRPTATGTLLKVPETSGGIMALVANEAIFDSDMVGLDVQFDTLGYRYTIFKYIRENVVHLIGSARAPGDQLVQEVEDFVSGTVASVTAAGNETQITESDTGMFKLFTEDMVGDKLVFDTSGNEYSIVRYVSTTVVVVSGDASAETGGSGAFKVIRLADVLSIASRLGPRPFITSPPGTFRADMVGTVALGWDQARFTLTGNAYDIRSFFSDERIAVEGPLASADIDDSAFESDIEIEKSFTGSTQAALNIVFTLKATDAVFNVDHDEGLVVVFYDDPLHVWSFEIVKVIDAKTVQISGDASARSGLFAIAHTFGRSSSGAPPVFSSGKSVLTASSAVFDSTFPGLVVYFLESRNKYTIIKVTSTTVVEVAGDATVETVEPGVPDPPFIVVGATGETDFTVDDAFTVLNTGGDYELPDDFAAIDGPLTYASGESGLGQIEITSEVHIRSLRQTSTSASWPRFAAIRPKSYDAKIGHVFEAIVWPTPNSKKTVTYRYQILYDQIDATHKFPPGGPIFSGLYLASCLAVAEQRVKDKHSLRTAEFQEKLAAMIDHDRKAHRAEFLGSPPRIRGGDSLLPAGAVRVLYNDVYYDGT